MIRRLAILTAVLILPGASLHAQSVAGRLTTASGLPVEAAFVVLEDSSGARIRSTLSDAGGRYLLRAGAAGRYRLRIERLGMATQTTDPLALDAGMTVGHDIVLVEKPVVLEDVVVQSDGRSCRTPQQLAADGARLWEEARKALSVAAWASESRRTTMLVERGLREEEHSSGRAVVAETDTIVLTVAGSPWGSAPAAELARLGFVRKHGSDLLYYGADAHLLLEDAFLQTHCFRQVDHPTDASLVGLRFEPRDTPPVTDIEGTLWLGRQDLALRTLEFGYVRLPFRANRAVGGSVAFRRLETGLWIVSEWRIHAPRPDYSGIRGRQLTSETRLAVIDIAGADGRSVLSGEALDLEPYRAARDMPFPGGTIPARHWAARICRGSAREGHRHAAGRVTVQGRPVADARIRVSIYAPPSNIGVAETHTDAQGRYHVCSVPGGRPVAVQVTLDGYEPQVVELSRTWDSFLHTDFALRPVPPATR